MEITGQLWGSKWVEWVELEANANRGWHNYIFRIKDNGVVLRLNKDNTLSVMMEGVQTDFRFCFTGAYGAHTNRERDDFWNELADVRGL